MTLEFHLFIIGAMGKIGIPVYICEQVEADVEILREWFVASDPQKLTCRPLKDYSREAVLKRYRERIPKDDSNTFSIRRVEDDLLVGRVSYFDLNPRNHAVEVGFLIGSPFRRRGYAFYSVYLLLRRLFNEMNINKVMAQTGEFNTYSIRILKKLGFCQDGRLRNHHLVNEVLYDDLLFSILKTEFRPLQL